VKPILLGTTSTYKIGVFEKLGIPFETAAPPFEEHVDEALHPRQLAQTLARGKALSLVNAWPDHLIIGADQVLALDDEVLTKPGSVDAAVAQLQRLSGRTHALHTAFAVLDAATGDAVEDVVTAEISFHANLDPAFLRRMVIADGTTDCVGAYKFERMGILLMERFETPDPNAIVGLPLIALVDALGRWGWLTDRFSTPAE